MTNLSDYFPSGTLPPAFIDHTLSPYTASAGTAIFCDSSGGTVTITLPAVPQGGDGISVLDVGDSAGVNAITLGRNGNTIDGVAEDFIINISGGRVDLAFDGTTWQLSYTTPGASGFTGKQEFWIPADAMFPASSGWTACANITTTNITVFNSVARYLAFDGANAETAYCNLAMPKRWDRGTITFQAYWRTSTTETGTVKWGVSARALSDDDPVGSFSPVYVDDTANGTQYDMHISPESGAVTVQGSPAVGDMVQLLIIRDAGTDTNTVDAWLEGIKVFWTTDAPTDD